MKITLPIIVSALTLAVAGCTTGISSRELQPIPGSITYNGQPRTKLTKSPIGSTFTHSFRTWDGDRYIETYQILPDRSLQIIDRRVVRDWPIFGRDD
ncbi:hypothetical protein G6L28_06140 [Agrobacterium larrymoorei]|uniref:hypothetical protein n=1 Tax=Agrobacterium larrymoorei TaxID=160699 RepID=UPI0015745AD2|nr:hypothetical protein [Agrobacterium larrymoorei]NTJ42180.1 hypothetical protein [Agrobacterium larrymoorei]